MARRIGSLCFGLTLTALLAFGACGGGESVPDLKVGDCIVSPGAEAGGERVRTVDCSDLHDGEVVAIFDAEGDDFPGKDALFDAALEGCPSEASTYVYPTEDSWNGNGDRQVTCIRASLLDLAIGDCLNYPAPESDVISIERRDCEDTHDARVIDLLKMPDADFPGDDAIANYALSYCPEGTDEYLGPTSDSWELFDDRQIVCLEE
jgi:hypothetical protein